jgi:hypothetical protein
MVGDPPVSAENGMTPGARRAVRQLRALAVALLVAVSLLVVRTFSESDRVHGEVDRRICHLAERTYSPPAATADGRRRQAANRQFAKNVLGCKV